MNISQLLLVSWISMIVFPVYTEGRDRELHFPAYYFFAERRLMNHTIEIKLVSSLDDCEYLCYLDDRCVSLNIKNKDPKSGTHECELNNSTHLEYDADLVNDPVFYYRGAKNRCGKNPRCRNNAICQSGFSDKGYRCLCNPGFQGEHCEVSKNCADTFKAGEKESGLYKINPDELGIIEVFCDQTTAGGGWLVLQKRLDGSVDFYRGWDEYKLGFGNLAAEFWLGLEKIYRLTSSRSYRLRVDLDDFAGNTYHAEYDSFEVKSEREKYKLSLGSYEGNATDKLSYHNGHKFSTEDQDNDVSVVNCAASKDVKGAWWYGDCRTSNLNGIYRNGVDNGTMRWGSAIQPIKRAEIKIRPVDF